VTENRWHFEGLPKALSLLV